MVAREHAGRRRLTLRRAQGIAARECVRAQLVLQIWGGVDFHPSPCRAVMTARERAFDAGIKRKCEAAVAVEALDPGDPTQVGGHRVSGSTDPARDSSLEIDKAPEIYGS